MREPSGQQEQRRGGRRDRYAARPPRCKRGSRAIGWRLTAHCVWGRPQYSSLVALAARSQVGARTRCSARSRRCRRRAGGCATRCPGRDEETSTPSRSLRPASPSRLRRRPGPTTSGTSLVAGAQGIAVPPPAPVVQARCDAGSVPRSGPRSAARRSRRPCRLDRPPDAGAANRRGPASTPRIPVEFP